MEANSLEQVARPLAARLAGPALGGWLIAQFGTGVAFLADAATFGVSIVALLLIRHRAIVRRDTLTRASIAADVREGFGYVRGRPWIWATLLAVAAATLFFLGPIYVLVPFIVKEVLGGSAGDLGLVFAAGGLGAIFASLLLGYRGLPRRHVGFMYGAWAGAGFALIGYALATALWQVILVSFAGTAALIAGQIVWSSLLQRLVPAELLGRVSSVDWLLSFGLVQISYAIAGPVAGMVGAETTLLAAGAISGSIFLLTLVTLPRVREVEHSLDRAA